MEKKPLNQEGMLFKASKNSNQLKKFWLQGLLREFYSLISAIEKC